MAEDAPGPGSSVPSGDARAGASSDRPPPHDGGLTDAEKSLRAQLLATEHWSLLASRSTTQGEVLTRIAIYLTLVSAGVFFVGILGQVTGFTGWFGAGALGVLCMLTLLGVITTVRVFNTATEDLMYVLAMNRLRGAYLDLAPDLEPFFLMSPNDDRTGARRTYQPLFPHSEFSVVFGSSMMLITVVTAVVSGLFAGGLTAWLGAATWVAVSVGGATAVIVAVAALRRGHVLYLRSWREHVPLRRTPEP